MSLPLLMGCYMGDLTPNSRDPELPRTPNSCELLLDPELAVTELAVMGVARFA